MSKSLENEVQIKINVQLQRFDTTALPLFVRKDHKNLAQSAEKVSIKFVHLTAYC